MADWYYIGTYGQLGPLTREQIDEMIAGGVITRETLVWKAGMSAWVAASQVPELLAVITAYQPPTPPPPPLVPPALPNSDAPKLSPAGNPQFVVSQLVRSDRNRNIAGILQFIPGFGRFYLGYWAWGLLQFMLTPCAGIGFIWSVIDGILILNGKVKLDGYGRVIDP